MIYLCVYVRKNHNIVKVFSPYIPRAPSPLADYFIIISTVSEIHVITRQLTSVQRVLYIIFTTLMDVARMN